MNERNLLKADDVAEILNVTRGHIYNLVSQRKIPAVRVFGALRFDPKEIENLIERGKINRQSEDTTNEV